MSTAYFKGKALTGPMGPQGPDGNPLGTIISYLGNEPPVGYLVCDGKEYQIADHSQLAAFFEKEFGSKNHFGGDGTSTFAVPDFRNLFLRGFHGESDEKLSGEIGAKQEGTEHINWVSMNGSPGGIGNLRQNTDDTIERKNPDTINGSSKTIRYLVLSSSAANYVQASGLTYTSRPVNAAVQYCIKATKSFEEDPPQGDISVGVFYNSKTAKVVVPASGWSANAPFTNTVAVADVIANADLQNIMVTPIEQHLNLQAKFGVIATSQGKVSLTFTAVTKPDVDIIYYVFVVGSEPVQDDIVVWSPKMTGDNTPKPWHTYGIVSSGRAWYAFDNNWIQRVGVRYDPSNPLSTYCKLFKTDDNISMLIPFVIYGVAIRVIRQVDQVTSFEIYGMNAFTASTDDAELIKTVSSNDMTVSETSDYITRTVLFDTPVRYGSYLIGNFKNDTFGTSSETLDTMISDIYFLRSKADIIAEGGTV